MIHKNPTTPSHQPPSALRAHARGGLILSAALLVAASLAGIAVAAPRLSPRLTLWGYADGERFSQPRGIAFDPGDGALYVANSGGHRIEVFSRTGRPLARFVHRVAGPDGSMIDGEPCALAFDRSGRLLVVDNAATYVDVLNRRGRPVTRLSVTAGRPAAVAAASDGTIYVGTTAEESKIHRFRADYAPIGSWGEQGDEPGRLHGVTALGELADGTIAVACARTELGVQIFTPSGEYLRGFGTHELGGGSFSLPSGLVGTADGRVWVIDEIRQNLQVFDPEGTLVAKSGRGGAAGGELAHPSSLASDGRGLMAVADKAIGRVRVFTISER